MRTTRELYLEVLNPLKEARESQEGERKVKFVSETPIEEKQENEALIEDYLTDVKNRASKA